MRQKFEVVKSGLDAKNVYIFLFFTMIYVYYSYYFKKYTFFT